MRLPEFRLEAYLERWEFAGRFHLTASDAQTLTVSELLALGTDGDREAFAGLGLGYGPTWGRDELREAIAATYDTLGPEHVLVFAGAEEALFWTLLARLGPGDHAVVAVPGYQSVETVARGSGADVSGLVLRPEDGWEPDPDALLALLRPQTRLVAVNFPNNPTGAVPPPGVFARIAELCRERGVTLLSDEVYRGLEQEPARALTQAADLSPTAVSVNVMSKAYGLPGLRLGWVASRDTALLARLERSKHYTSICSAGPSEVLATIALRAADRILARNRAIVADNLPVAAELFARRPELEWDPPQGGCVSFPRLVTGEATATWCRRLVERAGVVLLPADIFASDLGPVPADRFRIGVGRRDVGDGLAALEEFLETDRG